MSEVAEDIKKTAAWIAAHRLDLRTPAGTQIVNLIASALDNERARSSTRIATLSAENERLKRALEEIQAAQYSNHGCMATVLSDIANIAKKALDTKPR